MRSGAVLVVDDNEGVREALVSLLEREGFEVLSTGSGRHALQQLRARPDIRVVLLDLALPDLDGRAVRREQLADPLIAAIPVILLSAAPDVHEAAVELGAVTSLRKNVSAERVLEALAAHVG